MLGIASCPSLFRSDLASVLKRDNDNIRDTQFRATSVSQCSLLDALRLLLNPICMGYDVGSSPVGTLEATFMSTRMINASTAVPGTVDSVACALTASHSFLGSSVAMKPCTDMNMPTKNRSRE